MTATLAAPPDRRPADPGRHPARRRRRPERRLGRAGRHLVLLAVCAAWLLPVVALLVDSFRTPFAVTTSGWWRGVLPPLAFTETNYQRVLTGGLGRAL
ncbi:MAG TPA: hypothetical protein VE547_15565, partial [Mycobacteriales bacterium]|nr:hypothetical protein [Mycobacteriales bacterium]